MTLSRYFKTFPILLLLSLLTLTGCRYRGEMEYTAACHSYYAPQHARGFEIIGEKGKKSRIVRTKMPWQGADSTALDLLILRGGESVPKGFKGQVIDSAAKRIVAMSSSYIAALDIIGQVGSVVGVSGINYISNRYIREKYKNTTDSIDSNAQKTEKERVRKIDNRDQCRTAGDILVDVGNETNVDFEKLVSCAPDIVLLYGISSSSAMEEKLRVLKIPYFYMGEYLETDPLGRAEWMIALAEITGNIEMGIEEFEQISHRYDSLKSLIPGNIERPSIMLNAPYGDNWFMSPPKSSMVKLIEDAGGEYVYTAHIKGLKSRKKHNSDVSGNGNSSNVCNNRNKLDDSNNCNDNNCDDNDTNKSAVIDKETAWLLTSQSDFWLNPGQIQTLQELQRVCPGFEKTSCFKNRKVFNCDKRRTPGGGNDFWESGHFRPDIVLEDLIKILHPECGDSTDLYYYKLLK